MGLFRMSLIAVLALQSALALAANKAIPHCLDQNQVMDVDNQKVLTWKSSTQNQWPGQGSRARAFVRGFVTRVFADRNGHDHFEIQIGRSTREVLEVVYNQDFGQLPPIQLGVEVSACGDYITSIAPTPRYEASPSGAIIHWVHFSNSARHEDGFVTVNGELYGDHGGQPSGAPNPRGRRH